MHATPECGHTRLHERCGYCLALQAYWYSKLEDFSDAENTSLRARPLKKWTGISHIVSSGGDKVIDLMELVIAQDPENPYRNSLPESPIRNQERLLHHSEFDALCEQICDHGNHRLTTAQVKVIWAEYIEGGTNRSIAKLLGVNDTLVWRTINTLTQWTELMDLDESLDAKAQSLAKVVLREYNPSKDEGMIYATWRNALWFDDENRREEESDRFYRRATHSIRAVLNAAGTKVRIACLSDSEDFIVGYSVVTNGCLHFVYVKADYRNKRIGSLLAPKSVETVSPVLTKAGRAIAVKRGFIKQNKENLSGKEKEE